MEIRYSINDIKIVKTKIIYGDFYDVNDLTYNTLVWYVGRMVRYAGDFYLVKSIEHIISRKRDSYVYHGKKILS